MMKKVKRILFPVDLSETSPKIVPYALTMAEKFDAEIHLLFVARAFQYFKAVYVPNISIQTLENEICEGAERCLQEFKDKFFPMRSAVKAQVVSGDISEEILKYIENSDIDMLIMGTHGRKGLERAFFGSVADRVIKTAPVPVFVINPYRIS